MNTTDIVVFQALFLLIHCKSMFAQNTKKKKPKIVCTKHIKTNIRRKFISWFVESQNQQKTFIIILHNK